jgi:uncharacterized protein
MCNLGKSRLLQDSVMRIIRKAMYRTVPWKNGGGTATDIIASPEGAGYDAFHWRLSGAHVGRDGPFSLFPDIDRTMVILAGEALVLHGVPGDQSDQGLQGGTYDEVTLTKLSVPYAFPGDIPVTATLPAGPVDNLNMMSHRGRFQHSMRRLMAGDAIPPRQTLTPSQGATLLLFVERGHATVEAGGESAVLDEHDTAVATQAVVVGLKVGAVVVVIEVGARKGNNGSTDLK